MATVSSFEFKKFAEPDTSGIVGVARFNIRSESAGWAGEEGDDFAEALAAFKQRVPYEMRGWDGVKKLWTVSITPQTKQALCDLFPNADGLFAVAERQLGLFE